MAAIGALLAVGTSFAWDFGILHLLLEAITGWPGTSSLRYPAVSKTV
jgi:hypothetical protein